MEEKHKVEKLFGDVKEYAETKLDIMALNIQDKGSDIAASAASVLTLGIVLVFILLFLSLGAALIVGHYCFNDTSIGFFCVAGFYLVVFIVLYYCRTKLIKMPLINFILKKIHFHEED